MTDSIHEYAAKGFNLVSDAYENGRPEYPNDAIDFLISELKLNKNSRVADIGAGTGKFTKFLQKCNAEIIAIEPVEGMRKKFSSILPEIKIINGTAEKIPLENNTLDAVVVAQAFHWFDGEQALNEIHRVLKPNGKIGLIWNARDENIPWVAELTEIIDPYERGAPRYKSGNWKKAFAKTNLFSNLNYSKFGYIQRGDVNTIIDRIGSISFIASLANDERNLVLQRVQKLAEKSMIYDNDAIELPYRTDVFICTKL